MLSKKGIFQYWNCVAPTLNRPWRIVINKEPKFEQILMVESSGNNPCHSSPHPCVQISQNSKNWIPKRHLQLAMKALPRWFLQTPAVPPNERAVEQIAGSSESFLFSKNSFLETSSKINHMIGILTEKMESCVGKVRPCERPTVSVSVRSRMSALQSEIGRMPDADLLTPCSSSVIPNS